jgi:hypothetical protein
MRIHPENFAADDADALAGTALDTLEAGGQLDIYIMSTQADTAITITGPDNEPIVVSGEVPQGTLGTRGIQIESDPAYSLFVRTGGHYTVNIDIVTGATVQLLAIYRKKGVDF